MPAKNIGEVINELLGLSSTQKAIVEKDVGGLYKIAIEGKNKKSYPIIQLQMVQSNIDYGIVQVPREHLGFFPGYREQFILETDVKPFVMHLTGADDGTANGEEAGGYLCHPRAKEVNLKFLDRCPDANHPTHGTFKRFYEAHANLMGNSMTISRKSNEVYALAIPDRV